MPGTIRKIREAVCTLKEKKDINFGKRVEKQLGERGKYASLIDNP